MLGLPRRDLEVERLRLGPVANEENPLVAGLLNSARSRAPHPVEPEHRPGNENEDDSAAEIRHDGKGSGQPATLPTGEKPFPQLFPTGGYPPSPCTTARHL